MRVYTSKKSNINKPFGCILLISFDFIKIGYSYGSSKLLHFFGTIIHKPTFHVYQIPNKGGEKLEQSNCIDIALIQH